MNGSSVIMMHLAVLYGNENPAGRICCRISIVAQFLIITGCTTTQTFQLRANVEKHRVLTPSSLRVRCARETSYIHQRQRLADVVLAHSYCIIMTFAGTGLCSYRVRGVGGSFAEHLTVESYTIIISLQSYFYYWYSITHSLFHYRLKSFLFCESSLPQPFLCLLRDSLYGFPRLFTATSEHIRLFTF